MKRYSLNTYRGCVSIEQHITTCSGIMRGVRCGGSDDQPWVFFRCGQCGLQTVVYEIADNRARVKGPEPCPTP